MGFEQNEHRVKKLISDLEEVIKNFCIEGQKENKDVRDEVTNLLTASSFVFAKQVAIVIRDDPAHTEQLAEYMTNCQDIALELYNEEKRDNQNKNISNNNEFNNENLH